MVPIPWCTYGLRVRYTCSSLSKLFEHGFLFSSQRGRLQNCSLSQHWNTVPQDFEALTPNLLARTVETVEGGGLVVILLKSVDSLRQLYTLTMVCYSTEVCRLAVPALHPDHGMLFCSSPLTRCASSTPSPWYVVLLKSVDSLCQLYTLTMVCCSVQVRGLAAPALHPHHGMLNCAVVQDTLPIGSPVWMGVYRQQKLP